MIEPRRIEIHELHLSLRAPFWSAAGQSSLRRVLLVEMTDSGGASGWGECAAFSSGSYSPETPHTAWRAITTALAPAVLGRRFASPGDLAESLLAIAPSEPMARASIEMTAWDLEATKRSLPLATVLGGTRPSVEVGIVIGFQDSISHLEHAVAAAAAAGYRRIKLKIAPERDVEPLAAARRVAGEAADLAADANGSYSARDIPALRRLDRFALSMVEQPLPRDDLEGTARLQRELVTPICLDESILTLKDAAAAIRLGACRIINIKPSRVGGHSSAIAIADLAADHGIAAWCGGMLESGVGRAHNVALASRRAFTLPGDISPSDRYWDRDVVVPPWQMTHGRLAVPVEKPGIGVDLDRDYVRSLTVRTASLDAV
jgi:O-succinylbenzoate synthase